MKRRFQFSLRMFLVVTLLAPFFVGWWAQYWTSTPTLRFVVPAGFRGAILFKSDRLNGVSFSRQRDGVLEIVIPRSGLVLIRDGELFYQWHIQRAVFSDG